MRLEPLYRATFTTPEAWCGAGRPGRDRGAELPDRRGAPAGAPGWPPGRQALCRQETKARTWKRIPRPSRPTDPRAGEAHRVVAAGSGATGSGRYRGRCPRLARVHQAVPGGCRRAARIHHEPAGDQLAEGPRHVEGAHDAEAGGAPVHHLQRHRHRGGEPPNEGPARPPCPKSVACTGSASCSGPLRLCPGHRGAVLRPHPDVHLQVVQQVLRSVLGAGVPHRGGAAGNAIAGPTGPAHPAGARPGSPAGRGPGRVRWHCGGTRGRRPRGAERTHRSRGPRIAPANVVATSLIPVMYVARSRRGR